MRYFSAQTIDKVGDRDELNCSFVRIKIL